MKTKQILFTIAFTMLVLLTQAQDKYQFMVIEYSTNKYKMNISIDGTEFKQEEIDFKGQKKTGFNANPLLNKIKEYQDGGWEVMHFNTVLGQADSEPEYYFAYLRKKKTEK
jgi:hypothetical protein